MKNDEKRLMLLGIKYGPVLLSLTCSLKIFFLVHGETEMNIYEFIVHLINLFMDISLLGLIYIEGKTLGYCWKHFSLCKITLWGYLYYAIFLIFDTPSYLIEHITEFYVIFILFIYYLYYEKF